MRFWKKVALTLGVLLSVGVGSSVTAQADSHTAFIDELSTPVLQVSRKYHLYGSVMMAQAALESDWGTSTLSTQANNYFGVKGNYDGRSVTMSTSEANTSGDLYKTLAQFKLYPNIAASLNDYAKVLRGGTTWNPFLYQGAWRENADSYMSATAIVAKNYATDTNYQEKLNQIIVQYDLHDRFDRATAHATDADHTTVITPGVSYATYNGSATVKPGMIRFYKSVPGPSVKAKSIKTDQLANQRVTVLQRGIITKSQTIWYQVKTPQATGWVQLTDLLNLATK